MLLRELDGCQILLQEAVQHFVLEIPSICD